jgi:polyisoprenoid-binding protein YceI
MRSARVALVPLLLALVFAVVDDSARAQTQDQTWTIDVAHSTATFSTNHFFVSRVTGTMPIERAEIVLPADSTVPASAKATLNPAGLNTGDADRDKDLRSDHFFDIATYPTITFASTSIIRTDATHFTMNGNLTIHGVTHPVSLAATFVGTSGSGSAQRLTYQATTTIDRTQWGMLYGKPVVGTSIAITLHVEAVR